MGYRAQHLDLTKQNKYLHTKTKLLKRISEQIKSFTSALLEFLVNCRIYLWVTRVPVAEWENAKVISI